MPKIKPEYMINKDAQDVVEKLINMYPRHLGHLQPSKIGCVSIVNKERRPGQVDCKITGLKEPDSLFSTVQYILKFHQDDWDAYTPAQRSMMLFRQLYRIPDADEGPDGSILKNDLQDIKILVKTFGVDYIDNPSLPDLCDKNQLLPVSEETE